MATDLETTEWGEGEMKPIPGTGVRVTYGGELVEGVVLDSWFTWANYPSVKVGFWDEGMPEIGLPPTFEQGLFGRDEVEIISGPGEGLEGWRLPRDLYED